MTVLKLFALIEELTVFLGGQITCPYWGTNNMPNLGDKQHNFIGGQTTCPYWGTNNTPLLGEKQVALIEGQTTCLY